MKNRRRKLTSLLLVALMLIGMVAGLGAHSQAHSFAYKADGATITATCTDPDCGDSYSLTLVPPTDLTCNGEPKPATVEGKLPEDVYQLSYDVAVTYHTSIGGEPLSGAPAEPGDYVAQMTWGGANAVLSYSLASPQTRGGLRSAGAENAAKVGDTEYGTLDDAISAWDDGTTLTLLKNVETASTVTVSGTKTLDLNGFGIRMTGSGSVISVGSDATLTLNDSDTTTMHYYDVHSSEGRATDINDTSGSKSFTGGYITGGNAYLGGGVYVNGGTFNMNGGTILGNRADGGDSKAGGGVYVRDGQFTMNDGAISYNYAQNFGGGVAIMGDGVFTLNDGEISYNQVDWAGGAGVTLNYTGDKRSKFYLYGGKIINNRNTTQWAQGGIDCGVSGCEFHIKGAPVVEGNTYDTDNKPCNITLRKSDLYITLDGALTAGASIRFYSGEERVFTNSTTTDYNDASKFTSDNASYSVFKNSDGQLEIGYPPVAGVTVGETITNYSEFAAAVSAWNSAGNGATLTLLKDVETSSTITVSGTKTLDLNGFGIRMTGTDSVITVASGAALTLNDSNPDVEHKFTVSNPASNGAGLAIVDDGLTSGYQTFTGGYITGGKGKNINNWSNGGGIYLDANATVVMYGGTIIGNGRYNHTHGGALRTHGQGSNFTMYGGSLRNNEGLTGGAFRVSGGSVSIYGGSILYNRVSNDHGAISGDGALVLQDCEIRGNFAQTPSGGVMAAGSVSSVSGNTVIADNYVGTTPNNLQLATDKVLTITDKLTNTVPIGVTMQTPGVFTSGWSVAMGEADPSKYFTSDDNAYVVYRSGDELFIGEAPEASVSDASGANLFSGTFDEALAAWADGATLTLLKDVETSSTVTVSGTKTLDLGGHGIKATSAGYSVITISEGAALTVTDSAPEATGGANRPEGVTGGYVTGGSVGQNYGGGVTVDGGTLTLEGGAICGNANTYGGIGNCGGGVHVRNGGKLYMTGGEISGNTAYVGGGVCTDASDTTVRVTGGVIRNNKTERFGSAIWAGRGENAVFSIGGDASIIDNISTWTGDKDGEGTINSGVSLRLSGDPTVRGDWKTSGTSSPNTHINLDNVGSGLQHVALEGELTNETGTPKITVTPLYRWDALKNGQTFVFTENWETCMGTAHPAGYFKVDDSVTGIRVIRKDGEAALTGDSDELGDLYVFFDANGGTGTMDSQLVTAATATLTENAFTPDATGYVFAGWNTAADGSGTAYADKASVTLTGDLTLYAQWTDNTPAPTPAEPSKLPTPEAVFTAAGADSGTLGGLAAGMQYSLDGSTWTDVDSDADVSLTGLTECTILVVQKGDGVNTLDSETQSISVTKAETPELTVTQPAVIGENGSVNTTTAHEYSADDGETWTACTADQSLEPGLYLIRVKADGTVLASEAQTVTVTKLMSKDENSVTYIVEGKEVTAALDVTGSDTPDVMVGNLDVEAKAQGSSSTVDVTVTMSVESKAEAEVPETETEAMKAKATEETTMEYLSITIEKTEGSATTELSETRNVLEIIVPYKFSGKTDIAVYRYHDGAAQKLKETTDDPGADGTYRLDKENGLIYIYAKEFSTYAIGYTQCFKVRGTVRYGSYSGEVSVILQMGSFKETCSGTMSNGTLVYSFDSIPQGTYDLVVTWTENDHNVMLAKPVNVNSGKIF